MNTYPDHLIVKSIEPEQGGRLLLDQNNNLYHREGYRVTYNYHNWLPFNIVVANRDGLKVMVPSKRSNYRKSEFVIRKEIYIENFYDAGFDKFVSHITDADTMELRLIRDSFYQHVSNTTSHVINIIIEFIVTADHLRECDGSFYYQEIDNVISSLSVSETPAHPFSVGSVEISGTVGKFKLDGIGVERNSLINKIDIIDNNRQHGGHYCKILSNIYKIPSRKDLSKPDGVYFTHTKNNIKNTTSVEFITDYFGFDQDLKEIGIFKSEQEAYNSADINLIRKEEILRLEHELSLHKAEFSKTKSQFDSDALHRQEEINKLLFSMKTREAELNEKQATMDRERKQFEFDLERKRQAMKDEYEQRGNERKESQELIKMLPMIILSAGAVITAFMKFGNNSKKS